MHAPRPDRRGWTALSLLVTLACIVVLMAILLNALSGVVGGPGRAPGANTLRSAEDKLNLYAIGQSMAVYTNGHAGWNPVPSRIDGSDDRARDTTANLFSAMVMELRIDPKQLVSRNDHSGYVEVDHDYDFNAYDPARGVYWDDAFAADLSYLSNTSFAHMPLYGDRYERGWRTGRGGAVAPLVGNRGPENGIPDPRSETCDPTGAWAGHLVFEDAHVEFVESFTPLRDDDNIFAMESGPDGDDAILAFTREMDARRGPVLQFD